MNMEPTPFGEKYLLEEKTASESNLQEKTGSRSEYRKTPDPDLTPEKNLIRIRNPAFQEQEDSQKSEKCFLNGL